MDETNYNTETTETSQIVCKEDIIDIDRYNFYKNTTPVKAYLVRFATNCRATKNERKKDLLRIDAIENAEYLKIIYTQHKYRGEINCKDNAT